MLLKTNIKRIIFLFCLLCILVAGYLFFYYKSLPEYQIKYNAGTEVINGTEYAVNYAYYNHHIYKSVNPFLDSDKYPLGKEIGKSDREIVYAINGHKNLIATEGLFMSVTTYFKKIK